MATIINPNIKKDTDNQEAEKSKPMISSGQAAATPATQGQQAKAPTSGRFTNLSNYLSANKGAGQQISGQIQQGVQKDLGQKKKTAEQETGQFQSSIDASKGNVQKGQQYLGQITPGQVPSAAPAQQQATAPNLVGVGGTQVAAPIQYPDQPQATNILDVSSITSNPETLKQFTGLRTGTAQAQAAAEQAQQQNEAMNAATDVANTYGKRVGQIQSADRFGLLKEFLANPKTQYGRGLSSLDNAFLQRDPTKSLQTLNQNLQRESVTDTKQRADTMAAMKAAGEDVTQQGKDIAGKLNTQAGKNIEDYNKYFQENAANVNAQRKQEQDWAKQQYSNLQKGEAIDPKFAEMLGLTSGQTIGDVFNKNDISNYLQFGPTDVTSGLQAATPEQLARMNAIYQIAGQDFTSPTQVNAALNPATKFDPTMATTSQSRIMNEIANAPEAVFANNPALLAALRSTGPNVLLRELGEIQAGRGWQPSSDVNARRLSSQADFDALRNYAIQQGLLNTVKIRG